MSKTSDQVSGKDRQRANAGKTSRCAVRRFLDQRTSLTVEFKRAGLSEACITALTKGIARIVGNYEGHPIRVGPLGRRVLLQHPRFEEAGRTRGQSRALLQRASELLDELSRMPPDLMASVTRSAFLSSDRTPSDVYAPVRFRLLAQAAQDQARNIDLKHEVARSGRAAYLLESIAWQWACETGKQPRSSPGRPFWEVCRVALEAVGRPSRDPSKMIRRAVETLIQQTTPAPVDPETH